MSPQFASLQYFPGRLVRQSLPSEAIALGRLTFSAPSARCQLNSKPPLTSRVVGVALTATLESLSVGAAPTASPVAVASSGRAASAVAVSTRWLNPPHLTTLRVAGYVQGTPQSAGGKDEPQIALPFHSTPSAMPSRVADEPASTFSEKNGDSMEYIQVELPMVAQDPDSSSAGIRADHSTTFTASGRAPWNFEHGSLERA